MDSERIEPGHERSTNGAHESKGGSAASDRGARDVKNTKNAQHAGTVRWRNGKADVRLSLGALGRKTFKLPTCKTEGEAEKRRALLSELASKLLAAGRIELGLPFLEMAAQREGKLLGPVLRAIDKTVSGEAFACPNGEITFRQLGEMWTSGEIARLHPDNVEKKATAIDDVQRLEKHVYPLIQDVPVSQFTRDHAKLVMQRLPKSLGRGTRRHVAQVIHRPLALAVEPLGILKANPLPRGFVPKPARPKLRTFLYSDEDASLIGCVAVPFALRMLYAFLIREGLRKSEALRLEWRDLDLVRGVLNLLKNKTRDPRSWPMRPDVVRALRAWKQMREAAGDRSPLVFPRSVNKNAAAAVLRVSLIAAGITRSELHEDTDETDPTGLHALRAAFVTLHMASTTEPRNEKWIRNRTGHRSSAQLAKYDRLIDMAREMKLTDLGPMDELIPEIAAFVGASSAPAAPPNAAPSEGPAPELSSSEPAASAAPASAPAPLSSEAASSAISDPAPASAPSPAPSHEAPALGPAATPIETSAEDAPGWYTAGPTGRETSRTVPKRSRNAGKCTTSQPPTTPNTELRSRTSCAALRAGQ